MKAYLAVTGTIFALFALGHIVELVADWKPSDAWFMAGICAITLISAVLSVWAFRLLKRAG